MFTIEQIKEAHSKVKSGANFPSYIQEIASLGVIGYDTYVEDGHSVYYGINDFQTSSGAKYDALTVATVYNKEQFITDLKAHQQGKTHYMQFCEDCAKNGIVKWFVNITEKTCTYYDSQSQEVLEEQIPS